MKTIFKVFLLVVCILLLSEVVLRLMHIPTFPEMDNSSEKSVPGEYAGFHPMYGPYPLPGKYNVIFTDKWCQVTHNADSNRITRLLSDSTDYTKIPKLNIYGCSFTWGTGINDSSTYPFLVQKALLHYNVQNKGVFAAGNLITYLQLKDDIIRNRKPAIAVVAYASFHDQRNTMNREWSTMIRESVLSATKNVEESISNDRINFIDTIKLPTASLLKDSLSINYLPLEGKLFPLSRHFVICNLLNYFINIRNEQKTKSNLVTRKIFLEINKLCKENGIRLIVTLIDNDENTEGMKDYFLKQDIEYLNFDIDWNNNEYNLYPDLHPNEKANEVYAKKIIDYLRTHHN
jgi:hypothetical protein